MNITPLLAPYFHKLARNVLAAASVPKPTQTATLHSLVNSAKNTLWGKAHSYNDIRSYADFTAAVPVTPYPLIRDYVMRMIDGEKNILWRGLTKHFAQSSGTSDGKSKYVPITNDSLRLNHYRGATASVAMYLATHPTSRLFDGKAFILGGSYANELKLRDSRTKVGDLSATLIDCANPLIQCLRVPSKGTALMADWHKKLPALVAEASNANITNISGVPSWFLTVLRETITANNATTIHDVWPSLEVFFHGGISFNPYRTEYFAITDASRMHYWENYNASEGFFAAQHTPGRADMLLLMDCGVFYEFIPVDNLSDIEAQPIPAWEVESGKTYALVITACNGLWRYPIGDLVTVCSTTPLTVTIAGRTKSYINTFGEEVMVHNTDAALTAACEICNCSARDYTAAPVYTHAGHKGRHQWIIQFDKQPANIETFADTLDSCLCKLNSDYAAKRAGTIFLDRLTVTPAHPHLFDTWLQTTGKLGGQRKVPRLRNDRSIIDTLLSLNSKLFNHNETKQRQK